jgi:6-pyruvoyltetrahydropterin/6-carboxytetrahydropterin synthase
LEESTVSKTITFDMAHRLMNHNGLCKNIHGHTYKLQVDVTGKIDLNGMVIDFGDLKKIISHVVGYFDHSICLNEKDKEMIDFVTEQEYKIVTVPFETTAENLSLYFKEHILAILEDTPYHKTITGLQVFLWETPMSFAKTDNSI